MTEIQLRTDHKAKVAALRASYHERHEISHEDYHLQLNAENDELRQRLDTLAPQPQ